MRFSRRQLLGCGALAGLGLSLPELLRGESLSSESQNAGTSAASRSGKSCIFIYQYGGLSQLDSWDPKPQAPSEIRGPYRPIATATPGFQVGELMPNLARLSNDYAVIRSMTHGVAIHNEANRMLLAGDAQPSADAPSLGSIVTRTLPVTASVPPYVWLQKFGGGAAPPDDSYLTGGFLGMAHSPMLIGEGHDDNPASPNFRVTAFDKAAEVSDSRFSERWQLLQQMRSRENGVESLATGELEQFQQRAFNLLQTDEARGAFDLNRESETLRDRYGRNPMGQNLLLARRLVEAGVRLVGVVAWTGLKPDEPFMSIETWDMHGNAGIGIFDDGWNGLGFALPRADQAVATLLEDLKERGLLDSTLVVLVGEFGRTPAISMGAKAIGRDHWPNCYSAMLAGAGIQGGAVIGASDRHAAYVQSRPVTPQDFGATCLAALGIEPTTRLSPDGFTRPASRGEVIRELF